jgi:hypothetical protein
MPHLLSYRIVIIIRVQFFGTLGRFRGTHSPLSPALREERSSLHHADLLRPAAKRARSLVIAPGVREAPIQPFDIKRFLGPISNFAEQTPNSSTLQCSPPGLLPSY